MQKRTSDMRFSQLYAFRIVFRYQRGLMGNVYAFPSCPTNLDEEGGLPFVFRLEIRRGANGDVSISEECNRPLTECMHLAEYFQTMAALVDGGAEHILGGGARVELDGLPG